MTSKIEVQQNRNKNTKKQIYTEGLFSGGRGEVFLKQRGLEISFKEREGGKIMVGLRKGIPEFWGHGTEKV